MTDERALVELFHSALDREDVSGPFQRLRLELEKPGGARLRPGRRIFMTRNRLALLAAALVLVLGAVIVLTSQLLNGARPVSTVPAGDDVSTLLARPMKVQHVNPGGHCPDGPYTYSNYGPGPVYGVGGDSQSTNWGIYWNVGIDVPTTISGPIVFRGQDVVKGWPMVIISSNGVGPVYGHDVIDGTTMSLYTAAVVDTSNPPQGTDGFNGGTFLQWRWLQGFKHGWSGCVGFQVDALDFTEVFYSSGNAS